jgi:hypothetical protein
VSGRTFTLLVYGTYEIGVDGFWPNGDAASDADDRAAAEVAARDIYKLGIGRFISEWNLGEGLHVSVGAEDVIAALDAIIVAEDA